jgi:conjugative relaxase-like TrwC/TraI family protein
MLCQTVAGNAWQHVLGSPSSMAPVAWSPYLISAKTRRVASPEVTRRCAGVVPSSEFRDPSRRSRQASSASRPCQRHRRHQTKAAALGRVPARRRKLTPRTRRVGRPFCLLAQQEGFAHTGRMWRHGDVDGAAVGGGGVPLPAAAHRGGGRSRPQSTSLVDYYAATGYPPGRWLGSGLRGLNDGAGIAAGLVVTEQALAALYAGRDPVTGEPLGRPFATYASVDGRRERHAVAGFDLTFTVPKSVSVLWAMGDRQTRQLISDAHRQAVEDALRFVEERVAATRTGHNGIQRLETRGVIAAAFDHWDTRAGDPNLHTHLVIANKVQGPDGQWRALDARVLHKATVAISELYDNLVADRVAAVLPVAWSYRHRGRNRTPAYELDAVDDTLLAEFSQRARDVQGRTAELAAKFRAEHGRSPSRVERTKLAQQATRETRSDKTPHALDDLLTDWRQRARRLTGREPLDLAAAALTGSYGRPLHGADVGGETVQQLARQVVHGVQQRRATWDVWNLHAETSRATRTLRLRSTEERVQLTDCVVAAAVAMCIPLDGSAPTQPVIAGATHGARYTSQEILDAEQALLAQNASADAPAVPDGTADAVATATVPDSDSQRTRVLSPDQQWAVVDIATSRRPVDVLVGPAGTGKTLTLAALRRAWERRFGHGSVIGLAPSAAAAGELSAALGMRCETTAKWLWETAGPGAHDRATALVEQQRRFSAARANGDRAAQYHAATALRNLNDEQHRWRLLPGQLVIVDEAAMSGTIDLAHLAAQIRGVRAKLLLVGDHRQLGSVPAGGAFGLLARKGHTAILEGLWRFQHKWEAHATRQLRNGDPTCLEMYASHGRVNGGGYEAMLDAAHAAWAADRVTGRHSLLVAADNATVTELNQRVRTALVTTGQVSGNGVELRDGTTAAVGDLVVTRENARRIHTTDGRWVRNGDTWQVTAVHPGGALAVREARAGTNRSTRDQVLLDAHYVAEHVQLGYAVTAHRAQGATVDTSHVIVSPGMTREAFYVAMTRGRHANKTYVITEHTDLELEDHVQSSSKPSSIQKVLRQVLATEGGERSATEQLQQRTINRTMTRMLTRQQSTYRRSRRPDPLGPTTMTVDR